MRDAIWLVLLLPGMASSADLFRDRVAPLLEKRCVACHQASKKSGGLDLSTRAGLQAGGDSGPVIERQADRSRLLREVSGPAARMPRKGPKLTEGEVALLRKWIEAGAVWPEGLSLRGLPLQEQEELWWSFRPLARPAVPVVKDRARQQTPIDAFLLAALEAKGLGYSAEADRRTLLRRVTSDLTGLPPTPDEVDAFVRDTSPDAYRRVVERLLASPAYGERWGRHWLDVARYADTHGYDKDKRRDHAWPYRDWVVRALNSDIGYADFIRAQLAGDVLRPGDPEGIIAAGFVVAGPWDFVGHAELREGTVDKEKTRVLDRDDMVSSTLGTFTSLTVGCARCHDHKFDPIPQRDYYKLQAVFSGVERGNRRLALPGTTPVEKQLAARKQELTGRRASVEKQIRAATGPKLAALDEQLTALEHKLASRPAPAGAASRTNGYHSLITPGPDHTKWVQVDLGAVMPIDEVRLFPARPVDFRDAPGFGFPVRFKIELADEPTFRMPRLVVDHTGQDYPNPGDVPVLFALKDGKGRFVRLTATRLWKRDNDHCLALGEMQVESAGKEVARGKTVSALDAIDGGLWHQHYLVDGQDSRRQLPDLSDASKSRAYRERLDLLRQKQEMERKRTRLVVEYIPQALIEERARLEQQLASTEKELTHAVNNGPMVYSALPISPRPIWVLHRGDVEQKRDEVTPAGLACVNTLSPVLGIQDSRAEGQRRLALANWIADPRNVLTWRSAVNRVWHYHFGKGLVDTPSDFGKMGSLPSHPQLLDWLAVEFRQSGGSFKQLHRLIVTSAAYQQACQDNEKAARIDSDNRLLWRMNRQRLDAEGLRDAVLFVSGQLDRRMGGPGYDLFRFKDDHSPTYDHTDARRLTDPATYRRTVYRFTVRSVPNPFLDCLDCADPNLHTPVRNTTLTALQALALLNNPFMVRQANLLAERLEGLTSDPGERVEQLFRLAFGRSPEAEERSLVLEHVRTYGLASACRLMFNANEFVFVD